MSQVQICLCAVVSNKDFSVLDRVHSARVHINVRVKLLHGHLIPSCFQKPSQRGSRDPFTQA